MKFMNIYIWWIRPFVVHAHSWTCSWTYSWTIHEILTGEFMNVHEHSWTVIIHELFYSWTMSSWTVRKFMNCVHEVHELLQFMNWAICCSCTFMNLFMNLFMNYSWTIHEILTGGILPCRSWTIHQLGELVVHELIHELSSWTYSWTQFMNLSNLLFMSLFMNSSWT